MTRIQEKGKPHIAKFGKKYFMWRSRAESDRRSKMYQPGDPPLTVAATVREISEDVKANRLTNFKYVQVKIP